MDDDPEPTEEVDLRQELPLSSEAIKSLHALYMLTQYEPPYTIEEIKAAFPGLYFPVVN